MELFEFLALVEDEPNSDLPSGLCIFVAMIVVFLSCVITCFILGLKFKLRFSHKGRELELEQEKKYNEELVKRRPWIPWVVGIAMFGSAAGTILWCCGGTLP